MAQEMTSWGAIYGALRSQFPSDRLNTGWELSGVTQAEGKAQALFSGSRHVQADFLIGADGAWSITRRDVFSEKVPTYAGYIAWRGTLQEATLFKSQQSFLNDVFTFIEMPHSHILAYFIPGEGNSVEPGKRRLNWV